MKIVDNVFRLYREHLRDLKDDFSHEKNNMPESVSRVVASSSRTQFDVLERRKIFFGDKVYIFAFRESNNVMPNSEVWTSGHLEIKSEGSQLMEIYCMAQDDRYMGTTWSVSDVTAFIEGAWVEEINRFAQQVFSLAGQKSATPREDNKQKGT